MTQKTRDTLYRVAKWVTPFVIGALGFGAQRYDASLVHQSEYRLHRQADSTALQRIDRRTLKMLCHNNPNDSECP